MRFTDHIARRGEPLFEQIEALKLEGMMMKRKDSVYVLPARVIGSKVKTVAGKIAMQKRIEMWERE